jgi:hypothetical protein
VTPAQLEGWQKMLRETASNEDRTTARVEMITQGLYVFGGHHTQRTLKKLQTARLPPPYEDVHDRPRMWFDWPALIVGLPAGFGEYVHWLDVCSEFDNEPIALVPSWHDRVWKLRNRWLADFKTVEGFKQKKNEGKAADWVKDIQLALGMKGSKGLMAQMVQLVATPDYLWARYKKLLVGDYMTPAKDKHDRIIKVKGKAISSTSQVYQFFSLHPIRQAAIVDSVLKGERTLNDAVTLARQVGARIRCRQYIEKRFEELGAVDPATGRPPKAEWIEANTSSKSLLEDAYWNDFSARSYLKDVATKKRFNQLSETLWKNYNAKQKRLVYASDDIEAWLHKKVPRQELTASVVGAESSVLVIKDKTENLSKWITPQEFRKSSLLFVFDVLSLVIYNLWPYMFCKTCMVISYI